MGERVGDYWYWDKTDRPNCQSNYDVSHDEIILEAVRKGPGGCGYNLEISIPSS